MNVAYIISAYKLPDLLVRLVNRLEGPGTSILIHVDAKTPAGVYRSMVDPFSDRPNVQFLPRHPCYWGDFSHVRATLKGLAALLASGHPLDYVVLLTGQDYPLRTNAQIKAALRDGGGQVFMHWMPLPTEHWPLGGMDRIENWHFRVGGRWLSFPGAPFPWAWLNAAWSLPARFLPIRRSFPSGLRSFGGSSYWMMPADCARYVEEFSRANPKFVRFFEHVLVPDEIFFQTIVMNSYFRNRVALDDFRYIDWRGQDDHPRVLTNRDFDRLMQSGKLFARKFDPDVDATVLDRIDHVLDGGEAGGQ